MTAQFDCLPGPNPSRSNLAERRLELAPGYSSSASIAAAVALGNTNPHLSLLVHVRNYCQTRAKVQWKAVAYLAFDSFAVAVTAASSADERKYSPVLGAAMIAAATNLDGIEKAARNCLEVELLGGQLSNLEACFILRAPQLPSE